MDLIPPGLFRPKATYAAMWSGAVAVLAPGPIPTVDFYLASRLAGLSPQALVRFDSRSFDAAAGKLAAGTFVVIVRHAAPGWLEFLEANREHWSGVAFLMDDDIPAAWRCADVPVDYGLWTTGRYLWVCRRLARVCDRVWVSTETLRLRYPESGALVIGPHEFGSPRPPAPKGTRRWAYHGTRVHGRELRWLVPVVKEVQRRLPQAEFEVFGDSRVERMFRDVPRAHVLPALPWPDYLAHCRAAEHAVGVAPMLPGRFNAARSHVKLFDIARCGAVGIFSAREPYVSALSGLAVSLQPDDRALWTDEVVRLLEDDGLRLRLYAEVSAGMTEAGRKDGLPALINHKRHSI